MSRQRLYLDESGDHSAKGLRPTQWDKRYLCLFGCSFELELCRQKFAPTFQDFKRRYFAGDEDDPVVLHREHIKAKCGPFSTLRDPQICKAFDEELLDMVSKAPFRAFAVVIDKLSIEAKHFGPVGAHAYHIGLLALLERYCGWLRFGKWTGDVLAESRGGREDLQLKAAYEAIYFGGTKYYPPKFFQNTLTSREIKIRPKIQNIAALQLADLLAYPAKRKILFELNLAPPLTGFTREIAEVVEKKYNRRFNTGQVIGYGKIMVP